VPARTYSRARTRTTPPERSDSIFTAGGATIHGMRRPWDRHPPWAHWGFFVIWITAGTLGPIALVVGLLAGHGNWWIGAALCAVWAIDLGVDALLVRRLHSRDPGCQSWQPPAWKFLAGPSNG
jgi:hypothetical protein